MNEVSASAGPEAVYVVHGGAGVAARQGPTHVTHLAEVNGLLVVRPPRRLLCKAVKEINRSIQKVPKRLLTARTSLLVLVVWQGADQKGETTLPLRVNWGPLGQSYR